MEKEDARKQSREVLHERRKQVIRRYRKGMRVMQIAGHSSQSQLVRGKRCDQLQSDCCHSSAQACRARQEGKAVGTC